MTDKSVSTYRDLAETIFSLRFEAMPLWLADDLVAWLDDRSGVMHLFAGNPASGERRQLTDGPERIQSLKGASGCRHVVIGTDAGGNERQQLFLVDLDSGEERQLTLDPDKMHEPYCLSPDGANLVYRTNDGASGEFSLYVMELASGEKTQVWDDAGQVHAHAITEDGDILASLLTSNLDADLYLVREGEQPRPLLQVENESWILDASFAPQSSKIWVLTNADSEFVRLVEVDVDTGSRTSLLEYDWDVEAMALSPDQERLAWAVNRAGYSDVYVAPVANLGSASKARLPEGVADRLSWAPGSNAVSVGWTPVDAPARVWRIGLDGAAAPLMPSEQDDSGYMGKAPELIEFTTWDGRQVPAFWFPAKTAGAPTVIDVHGGPESQRRAAFHPVLQHLWASGFNVLTTNVRGSTGYGKEYSHLDDIELRMDSVRDLEHAHAWVAEQETADSDRIGIMGQSYGGFMTLAAVTEYPDRWYAAVDVVGIANFVSFLERTSAYRRRHRSAEYGNLEQHRELLQQISPIRKVDKISAPMLVIHGRNDPRVPVFEAEQLVESLSQREHPVELLVFENEGHGLSKRPNRIEGYARVAEFFWKIAGASG